MVKRVRERNHRSPSVKCKPPRSNGVGSKGYFGKSVWRVGWGLAGPKPRRSGGTFNGALRAAAGRCALSSGEGEGGLFEHPVEQQHHQLAHRSGQRHERLFAGRAQPRVELPQDAVVAHSAQRGHAERVFCGVAQQRTGSSLPVECGGAIDLGGASVHELGAPPDEVLQVPLRGARRRRGFGRDGFAKGGWAQRRRSGRLNLRCGAVGVLAFGSGEMPRPRGVG